MHSQYKCIALQGKFETPTHPPEISSTVILNDSCTLAQCLHPVANKSKRSRLDAGSQSASLGASVRPCEVEGWNMLKLLGK